MRPPATSPLAGLSRSRRTSLRRILEGALARGGLRFAFVYGSVSRGDDGAASDLDVYYETSDGDAILGHADPDPGCHVFGAPAGSLLEGVQTGDAMALAMVEDALVVYGDGAFDPVRRASD